MPEPRLRIDGQALALRPLVGGGMRRPQVAGAETPEIALFGADAGIGCVIAGGPRGPLSAVTSAALAGLRLADPEELHGTGLGDAAALFGAATGGPWWLRHLGIDGRTGLFPLDGAPGLGGLGHSDAAARLDDGRLLLVSGRDRLVTVIGPNGQVEAEAAIAGWIRGAEEAATIAGGWLFSSHVDGRARVLAARRIAGDGVGPRLELGRVDHDDAPTGRCTFLLRAGPAATLLAVQVAGPGGPPRLATTLLRGDRWLPLTHHGAVAYEVEAQVDGARGRVAWRGDDAALVVVEVDGADARRRVIAAPEECALDLLGDGLLGRWEDEAGLVVRLHELDATPRPTGPAFALGLPGDPWAWEVEAIARGAHGLLLISDRDRGRLFGLRVGADASLLPLP